MSANTADERVSELRIGRQWATRPRSMPSFIGDAEWHDASQAHLLDSCGGDAEETKLYLLGT